MKTKLLLLLGLFLLVFADVSQGDGRRGRWRGNWDDGPRWHARGRGNWDDGRRWRSGARWRGNWDDSRRWRGGVGWGVAPRWRGGWGWGPGWGWRGGWGGWGPFGVGFVAPLPIYSGVYVSPAPSYVAYSASTLYRAQARLARLGYYAGPIDGDFGPMTSGAIRSYQADYGLPVTGHLDYRTRASLGV